VSNRKSHRRGDERHAEHGPRWEGPETDRNSARARRWWKKHKHRTERRNDRTSPKFQFFKPGRPLDVEEEEEC